MTKVVILGANGQLGSELMQVFGGQAVGLTHADVDITDLAQTTAALKKYQPQIVLNAAGIVKSEWCELNPGPCKQVNAQGAGNIAQAARALGAIVLYFSTDYVFGGGQNGFTETDPTNPINVYGRSKVSGEQLVMAANPKHYIIRTSWVFGSQVGRKGYDFPRLMLRYAKEQPVVRVVDDQVGSPTYAQDLVGKIKELIEREVPYGIYHITNQGQCSWYTFAKTVFVLTHTTAKLEPITSAASGSALRRPDNSVLLNTQLPKCGIPLLRPWEDALAEYVHKLGLVTVAGQQ